MMKHIGSSLVLSASLALGVVANTSAMEIVKNGAPVAAIWHLSDGSTNPAPRGALTEAAAAAELAQYLGRISGATLEIKAVAKENKPKADEPAIIIGQLALEMGLPRPPETISGDGYRIQVRGRQLLMAGETASSTFYAVSHFLNTLGCRWFFDNELGEVVPSMKTIAVDALDVAEKPDFASRSLWGSSWYGNRETWCRRNRLGGLTEQTGHDWGQVPAAKYGAEHPEYYALRGGARKPGNWLCTSNPDVQRIFAEGIAAKVRGKGCISVSISPPDGSSYCECAQCRALDDPKYIEAGSGRVAISDRYQLFFNAIGNAILKVNPQAQLNYYAYADYSMPPLHAPKAPSNLCVWSAPLMFCRLHSLSNTNCESRQRCRATLEGWSKVVSKLGWREYNYNVAESCVPFSKISIWKDDIPLLKKMGCTGLNIECMALWHIYGPHTYLITRLAWDADADVPAIMDDFYNTFCGKAAPHVKAYWERIDKAVRETRTHAGSFYAVHTFWTPELVRACEADLDAAAKVADNELIRKRVAMFRMGLENARYYLAVRDATMRFDYKTAKTIFDQWLAHMDGIQAAGIHPVAGYKRGYAPRFIGQDIQEGCERTTGGCRLLVALPDEWDFRYDPKDMGESNGWHKATVDPAGWTKVKTYSATLNEQGIPEKLMTYLWYRARFQAPAQIPAGPVHLWFGEIDGKETRVFLNGELAGEFSGNRKPNEVDIAGKLKAGQENVVAVKIHHRQISELMLGGIIKPVMIYAGTPPAPKAKEKGK